MAGKDAVGLIGPPPRPIHSEIVHPRRTDARLAVLWVGHATALVQIDDRLVLTDPVFTSTIAQVSKRKVEPGLHPENLPTVDVVLISHMHADHLSYGSLEKIEHRVKHALVPQGGLVYMPNFRFDASELPTWHSWKDGELVVTAVPVEHVGWRYGVDVAWMQHAFTGYVIQYHGLTVYFGGDTAYDANDFAETAAAFPSIDLALLPIAPIHPRAQMKPVHEDPREALQAFDDLRAKVMVPIHFDTFPSGLDKDGEAVLALRAAAKQRGLDERRVQILAIGEQRVIVGTEDRRAQ
jgi:L-ascorbate metabolism protein UlaG (beta-lactamase superfamily)